MSKLFDDMGSRLALFLQVPHDPQDLYQFVENEIKRANETAARGCEMVANESGSLSGRYLAAMDSAARIRKLVEEE